MKIVFIGGRDIHKLGGIENYMYNLCSQLVHLGFEPIVYCESDSNKIEWVNGFKVVHWKSVRNTFLCKPLLGIKSTIHVLIHEKNVTVFHYNAWPPFLASCIARLFGRQVILMGHGLEWKRTKYSPKQQKIMKLMEKITAKNAQYLLMCSQEQTDYFRLEYNRECVTMPTAINVPKNERLDESIFTRHGIKKGEYFLYLGRLVQEKNPDFLIKAYIKSGIVDRKLVIAGGNDSQPEYVKLLHDLGKSNENVIFTGPVYTDDKEALLKHCTAFCIPSTIEGLAITLLEAMSYKKICIIMVPRNWTGC